MTDYIIGLNLARDEYNKDQEIVGMRDKLGIMTPSAETPEKFVEGAEEGSIVKNTLGKVYQNDSGEVKGQTTTYQIKPGDTLSEIALEYKMSVPQIMNLNKDNPAIKTKDLIYAGGTITIAKPEVRSSSGLSAKGAKIGVGGQTFDVEKIMSNLSNKYKVPYKLVKSVAQRESNINPFVEAGDAGTAFGMMQVRNLALKDVNAFYTKKGLLDSPITIGELNPSSPNFNLSKSIEAGVAYLALTRDKYKAKGNYEMAAMYNGGPRGLFKKAAKDYAHGVSENAEIIQEYEDPYGVNIPNKTFTSIPALGIGDLEVVYKDAISAVGVNPDLLMTAKNRLQGKYDEEPEFLKNSKPIVLDEIIEDESLILEIEDIQNSLKKLREQQLDPSLREKAIQILNDSLKLLGTQKMSGGFMK